MARHDAWQKLDVSDVVAWLSQLGAVVIPGVGFFIGSREFLRALTQRDDWTIAGGSGEILGCLGIPRPHAARYGTREQEDATLVFVSCDGSALSQWAREILRHLRAEAVSLLGECEKVAGANCGKELRGWAS